MSNRGRVYVAGSSSELPRVKAAMARCRAAGYEITHDWVAEVEAVGSANPTEATLQQRRGWATADFIGIGRAQVVWLLVPYIDGAGAYVELGYAINECVPVVASGGDSHSIFLSLCRSECSTDEVGFLAVQNILEQL